jgi:hypothetical protein
MDTLLHSHTRTVRIGPDEPFVIIGERINPTGRKLLAAEMAGRRIFHLGCPTAITERRLPGHGHYRRHDLRDYQRD